MKGQQKYITSIVLLVATIYLFGKWMEGLFGKGIAVIVTSVSTISLLIYGLYLVWDKWLWKKKWLSYLLCKLAGFYEYPVIDGKWHLNYDAMKNV